MSLSNKFGALLLSTGNKSELAVGYCTLYGDMAGGLAVISDVPKTSVYRLANYLNRDKEIIPAFHHRQAAQRRTQARSKRSGHAAALRICWTAILQLYVEDNLSALEIIGKGFDAPTVRWIQRRVDLNEYKRAQAVRQD